MSLLPIYIASRFSRTSPGARNRSGLTVGIIGVALSLMVMIISIGVMTGFKQQVRRKVIGFESAITLAPGQSAGPAALRDNLFDTAFVNLITPLLPDGATVDMTIRQPAILKTPETFAGGVIKGVDGSFDAAFINESLIEGAMPDYASDSTLFHIVVSATLARSLSAGMDDKIDAFFIGDGGYRVRRLKIKGIFDTHFDELDKNYLIGSAEMLRQLSDLPEGTSTLLEINSLPSDVAIDTTAAALSALAAERFYSRATQNLTQVINIHDSGALYFNWLSLLDTNVAVILTLMGLLAALTLVSSLFILVLRRVRDIGILKAIGAKDALIRRVFVAMTLRVLLRGMVVGNLLGIGILWLQKTFNVVPLDPEAYYLDTVPVSIDWSVIILLNAATAIIAFLILQLPSAIVSTISPARTISYN